MDRRQASSLREHGLSLGRFAELYCGVYIVDLSSLNSSSFPIWRLAALGALLDA